MNIEHKDCSMKAYSSDGEYWTLSYDSVMDDVQEQELSCYYKADAKPVGLEDICKDPACWLLEYLDERFFDEIGAEDCGPFTEVSSECFKELNRLISEWCLKNVDLIGFFIVDIKSKTKVHAHGARGDD